MVGVEIACNPVGIELLGAGGFEPFAFSSGKPGQAETGGSNSGNIHPASGAGEPHQAGPADPELAELLAAWPTLPAAIKAGIIALARAGGKA